MTNNSESSTETQSTGSYSVQRRLCLDHAGDLVASAERILGNDNAYANISYHLAVLALEEIGKAGMLGARAAVGTAWDPGWLEKRLDKHIFKLLWALWSPTMLGGKVDPEEFRRDQEFAKTVHEQRLAGLYFNHSEDNVLTPPREAISLKQATSILGLARASLELESARGTPTLDKPGEELVWYLDAVDDEYKHKYLFSRSFLKKSEEFGGDARAWIRWARAEIERLEAEGREQLQRELNRQVEEGQVFKPKWLMKIRLYTPSHSVRQKALNVWNDRVERAKLRSVNGKKNEILMELHINDSVKIKQLFHVGLAESKRYIVMLCVGSGGVFWFELSGQTESYFEKVEDLDAPRTDIKLGRAGGLAREWSEVLTNGRRRERIALEQSHLENALKCLAAFGTMSYEEASPIFGPYLTGLTFLCKSDLHLTMEAPAREAFRNSLRQAMQRFGDWDGDDANFGAALHRVFAPVIVEEADRNQLFEDLNAKPKGGATISHAISTKWVMDLYLTLVATRRLSEMAKDKPGPL